MNVLDVVNATHGSLELNCEDFEIVSEGVKHRTRYFFNDGSSIDVEITQHRGPNA